MLWLLPHALSETGIEAFPLALVLEWYELSMYAFASGTGFDAPSFTETLIIPEHAVSPQLCGMLAVTEFEADDVPPPVHVPSV